MKRAWRADRPDLFPEIVDKAFHLAESGRPGPVLISVPMDVFSAQDRLALVRAGQGERRRRIRSRPSTTRPRGSIVTTLLEARKPLLYVGGGILLADAAARAARLSSIISEFLSRIH